MAGGFGFRLLIQVGYFVLLARSLGSEEYGSFVGVLALVTLLAPFSTWGSGNILIKRVSRNPEDFPLAWGAALATTMLFGSLMVFVVLALVALVFGMDAAFKLALPIALGDVLGIRLADVAAQAFQSVQRMAYTSAIWLGMGLSRLAGVGVLLLLPLGKEAEVWAWIYAFTGLLIGALGVVWVGFRLGWGPLSLRPMKGLWLEGFYFAVSLSSQGTYNDVDKAILSRQVSDAVAGVYAAAYRALDAAFVPVRGLIYALYPVFFRVGVAGLGETRRLALRFLPVAFFLTLLSATLLVVLSPWIVWFLGGSFEGVSEVVVWLLPVLFLRTLHYFAADALTGAGWQGLRTFFQIGVAVLNLGLNLLVIPIWSWKGAAIVSWVSDGLLALSLWGALFFLGKKRRGAEGTRKW